MKNACLTTVLLASTMSASASPFSFVANRVGDDTTCALEGTALGDCFSDNGYWDTEYECYSDCEGPEEPESCAGLCTVRNTCGQKCVPQCYAEFLSYWDCAGACSCSESGSNEDQPCAAETTETSTCLDQNGYLDTMDECFIDCGEDYDDDLDCAGFCALTETCLQTCTPLCETQFNDISKCISVQYPEEDICGCSALSFFSVRSTGGNHTIHLSCDAETTTTEVLTCLDQNGYVDTMSDCFTACASDADDDLDCAGLCALTETCLQACTPLCETQALDASKCYSEQFPDEDICACAWLWAGSSQQPGSGTSGGGSDSIHPPCDAETTEASACLDQNGYLGTFDDCFYKCVEVADDDIDCAGGCALIETCLQECSPQCQTEFDAVFKCNSAEYPDKDTCACAALRAGVSSFESVALNLAHDLKTKNNLRVSA